MNKQTWNVIFKLGAVCAIAIPMAASGDIMDINVNGGFETGTTDGWAYFPTSTSTFTLTGDAHSGSFAGELFNDTPATPAVIKQANLAAGLLTPGGNITISFWAKGVGAAGGVSFAELFSEIDGGGISKSEILGGTPLNLNPTVYLPFSFTTTLGPDVSGGVTLQLAAITGGDAGSEQRLFIDDVSILADVIPEPGTAILLALGGSVLLVRSRILRDARS